MLDLHLIRLPAFALVLLVVPPAMAVDEEGSFCDVFSYQIENDQSAKTDRHYTGGARAACTGSAPRWVDGVPLPETSPGADIRKRLTFSIGHSVFTPDDITLVEPIEDDHPYAGWLYLGFGLDQEVVPGAGRFSYLDRLELQLGVVGPLAVGEQIQRQTHKIFNATDPAGWDNQLDNEPGINLFYSRQWTGAERVDLVRSDGFPDLSFDLSPVVGVALGNVHLFGAAGMTARLGSFDRLDHGPALIRPGLAGGDGFSKPDGFSAYLFAGFEGRVVGRNIFLDGNSFKDNGPSVEKGLVLAEARLGFAMTYKRLRLGYSQVFRTREFDNQDLHSFGSLTLAITL